MGDCSSGHHSTGCGFPSTPRAVEWTGEEGGKATG